MYRLEYEDIPLFDRFPCTLFSFFQLCLTFIKEEILLYTFNVILRFTSCFLSSLRRNDKL